MSSYVDQIIANAKNGTPTETESTEQKPAETQPTETEQKPEETKPAEPAATPAEEPPAETKPAKPDLSTISKEEKAEHAFKRQLAKQKEKYEGTIASMNSRFDSLEKMIKEGIAPKKEEPVKTRADFPLDKGGDDAYIAYLTKRGVTEALAEQKAEQEKAAAEKAEQDKIESENQEQIDAAKDVFRKNCESTFTDAKELANFHSLVGKALDRGLAEVLDIAPAVRDYIFTQPDGPAILNKMLQDRPTMEKVLNVRGNPMLATITLHELGAQIRSERAKPAEPEQQAQPKGMPHIGKPGARSDGPRNVMGSDKDIIKFIRSVH